MGNSDLLNSKYIKPRLATLATLCALGTVLAIAPGCPLPQPVSGTLKTASTSSTTTTTAATVITGTPRAVKIILKQAYPSGSFDAAPVAGTVPSPGNGHPAVRIFNPDGSLLSSDPTSGSWPKWLKRFEIGISGPNNTSATNSNCAKFADLAEAGAPASCCFPNPAGGACTPLPCGAGSGMYRVSEYDCAQAPLPADGNGGPSDGIYLRATLDRTQLGTGENLMGVLEYVASSYNTAPPSPTNCFSGGVLSPEKCSDQTWKAYVKHTVSEVVQPFFMLVPPVQNFALSGLVSNGVSPNTRQFIFPLVSDPNLSVVQISRVHSNLTINGAVTAACRAAGGLPANSPLCAGIIIYSLTLYRM